MRMIEQMTRRTDNTTIVTVTGNRTVDKETRRFLLKQCPESQVYYFLGKGTSILTLCSHHSMDVEGTSCQEDCVENLLP